MPEGTRTLSDDVPAALAGNWDEDAPSSYGPARAKPEDGVWRVVRGHRWRMLAVATLVVGVTGLAYPHIPRRYQSAAELWLHPTNLDGQGDFSRQARDALDDNSVQAELDILTSRVLAREVAGRLKLAGDPEFNPSLRTNDAWAAMMHRVVAALPAKAISLLRIGAVQPDSEPGQEAQNQAIERTLLDRLAVKRDRHSYVLRVTSWSENPDKAARLVNTLLAAYIEVQLDRKRAAQARVAEWLHHRVAELEQRFNVSEGAVQNYLVESGLINTSAQSSLQQQLTTLSSEVAVAESHALELQGRARSLTEMQRSGALDSAPEVMSSPLVHQLRERIAYLTAGVSFEGSATLTGATVPALNELRQAVGAEAQRILRGAQMEAAAAEQRVASLRAAIERIGAELTGRQRAERRLEALRREASADRAALEEAMARYRTEAGRLEVLRPDAEVVAMAEAPVRPAFPNGLMVAMGTLALACAAAFAVVLPSLLRRRWVA